MNRFLNLLRGGLIGVLIYIVAKHLNFSFGEICLLTVVANLVLALK